MPSKFILVLDDECKSTTSFSSSLYVVFTLYHVIFTYHAMLISVISTCFNHMLYRQKICRLFEVFSIDQVCRSIILPATLSLKTINNSFIKCVMSTRALNKFFIFPWKRSTISCYSSGGLNTDIFCLTNVLTIVVADIFLMRYAPI